MFPPSPQCSVPARYARLHYALGGGGKETKPTTNILLKVPNLFQDLTALEWRLVKVPAKAGACQRFLGLRCVFAAATAKPPGSRVSFPGPAVWCRQTRRNARLQRWVLRSFRWNAKAPSAPAPLLADFGDALGRPRVVLRVASGWLQGAYRLATRWLRGGFGVASEWLPCLAAFRRPASLTIGLWLFPARSVSIAFRRSALPAREDVRADRGVSGGVSIAFRRSLVLGQSRTAGRQDHRRHRRRPRSRGPMVAAVGLHCLSASRPPGTPPMTSARSKPSPCLHCLSASRPSGTRA